MREDKQPEERDLLHEDPLRTARGIAWGIVIGGVLWTVIIGLFVLWLAH